MTRPLSVAVLVKQVPLAEDSGSAPAAGWCATTWPWR